MILKNKVIDVAGKVILNETTFSDRYSLTVTAEEDALLHHIAVELSFDYKKDDRFFVNGYQSWTYSPERGVKDPYKRPLRCCPKFLDKKFGFSKYGDAHFCKVKDSAKIAHGYTYAYVRRDENYYLFASLDEKNGFTRIILDVSKKTVTFEKDCAGKALKKNEEYTALDLYFGYGKENEVFDSWFEKLGIHALTTKKATGYTSWYNCYQNISEKQILADLEGMRHLPVTPTIFQIDDGFEPFVGDWLTVDAKKFPGGLEPIVKKISDDGFIPGIWLAPFVCETKSDLYKKHPNWLLRDENGSPVYCGSNWSGAWALDTLNAEVRDYIAQTVGMYRQMGFKLFKLDFLYAACMIPHDGKTRGELMEDAAALLRKVCGDCAIIGCGVPLCAAFGKMEYCRIGPDVSLDYDDKPFMRLFHAERNSTKHTVINTVYRRQLSGRAFLNDPDVFILRTENTTLTGEQKDLLATVNALFGGVLFTSDEFSKYSEYQKQQYAAILALKDAENITISHANDRITFRYTLGGDKLAKSFSLKTKQKDE